MYGIFMLSLDRWSLYNDLSQKWKSKNRVTENSNVLSILLWEQKEKKS